MNRSQWSSSPGGIRSGLVRTPVKAESTSSKGDLSKLTDGSFALRVVLFRDMVRALVLKVRCTGVSIKMEDASCGGLLSQVTVSKIKQLGLQM